MIYKKDLIEEVSKQNNWGTKVATESVNAVFDVLEKYLKKGEKVQITGFGTFRVSTIKKHDVVTFNGEKCTIPKSKTVKFVCGQSLKNIVNKVKK